MTLGNDNNIYLGITFNHGDSSAALVKNGQLIAAVEEERLVRVKHYALFPKHAIEYCLRHANIGPSEVSAIAIGSSLCAEARRKKIAFALSNPRSIVSRLGSAKEERINLKEELIKFGLSGIPILKFEHHLAHMASARFLTAKNEAALLSFDGLGDFVSTASGVAKGADITILNRVFFPHSLGFFYTAMTQFLGFPYFGDEFKVMGLSSYGEPRFVNELRQLVCATENFGFKLNQDFISFSKLASSFYLKDEKPYINTLFNPAAMSSLLGIPARIPGSELTQDHRDIAKSIQQVFEEVAAHLLNFLYDQTKIDTVCLAGGCAHNSVFVGKVTKMTKFKQVYVAPASHDAGIAVGAAILAHGSRVTPESGSWASLGPPGEKYEKLPENTKAIHFANDDELLNWMVDKLCQEKIIGLMHGRLEFGPRALGNRSIIVDPRSGKMKDLLNSRIKNRESFRPFAASVLYEYQAEWFEGEFYAPFMDAVFTVKTEKRAKIPAVVHADGSCRIQSVTEAVSPFYWRLIDRFRRATGVPMLLNTSFNDNEPIVCSENDALSCFQRTKMDYIVLNDKVISRD